MRKRKIFIAVIVCTILNVGFLVTKVLADGSEGGEEGGDAINCGYNLCSSYGAAWRYYKTDKDEVFIPGTVNGVGTRSPAYAADTYIRKCATNGGGYWRYAMVAQRTVPGAVDTRGNPVVEGDQVGTTSIGNTNSLSLRSEKFPGGKMRYISTWASWDKVKEAYENAKKTYPNIFLRGWDEYSTLAWFCADDPELIMSGVSNVSAADDYSSTGIVTKDGAPHNTSAPSLSIKTGDTTKIAFSHNIYASQSTKNVEWQIKRTTEIESGGTTISSLGAYIGNGNYYTIKNETTGEYKGWANVTSKDGDKYVAVKNGYLTRDEYPSITFNKPGKYKFCEDLYIKNVQYTHACAEINVDVNPNCTPGEPGCPNDDDDPGSSDTYDSQAVCKQWTPSSYTNSNERSGQTSVISAVKTSLPKYSEWVLSNAKNGDSSFYQSGKEVYAKPSDTIYWIHCYYPGVQKTADTDVTYSHHSHSHSDGAVYHNGNHSFASELGKNWQNMFSITSENIIPATGHNNIVKKYSNGDSDIQSWKVMPDVESYNVPSSGSSRAGKSLKETITSGGPTRTSVSTKEGAYHSWSWECNCTTDEEGNRTCSTCSASHGSEPYYTFSYSSVKEDYQDAAMVKVPYNYENQVSVSIDRSKNNGVANAGETIDLLNPTVYVNPRYNSVTEGSYATKVDGGELKVIAYVTNNDQSGNGSSINEIINGHGANLCNAVYGKEECKELDDYHQTFNTPENLGGSVDTVSISRGYNVFDNSAGKWYCVAAAVYPADSGSFTRVDASNGSAGSDSWRFSVPDCVQIAKKPSIQVWGNSMYTSGKVETATAGKNLVAGVYGYDYGYSDSKNYSNKTIFGSWVEQSIVHLDSVKGMASGAAMGNFNPANPSSFSLRSRNGLGGSREGGSENECIRVPLTISNYDSVGFTCGHDSLAGATNKVDAPGDKSALVSRFTSGSSNYNLHDNTSVIGNTTVSKSTTDVYISNGDITINGNITYEAPSEGYQYIVEIPKVIIYAKNITIACNVSRIDAVLIAEDTVDTCPTPYGEYNSKDNSNRLTIFGTVIADKMSPNRTYGAGPGVYSTEPAEIINYDTSLYLWGAPRADASASGKLEITYQTELSPRY